MKTVVLPILLALFFSSPLFSQNIVIQNGNKVEVRDIKGGYVTSGYYSGLKDIAQGENIIVLWYESGKVEIRDYDLHYRYSAYYSNLVNIGATKDYVVLYYENDKIEVRDEKLGYFSSWYR